MKTEIYKTKPIPAEQKKLISGRVGSLVAEACMELGEECDFGFEEQVLDMTALGGRPAMPGYFRFYCDDATVYESVLFHFNDELQHDPS